jgi:hypothetical protein
MRSDPAALVAATTAKRVSNVFSLEAAAARRGRTLNYLSTLMAYASDEILLIALPLHPGAAPTNVLVLLASQQRNTARVLLSDEGGSPVVDYHLFGSNGVVPAEFSPQPLGSIAAYLALHAELTERVLAAGGVAHGNLTIARAVHLMATAPALDSEEALRLALETSRDCAQWAQHVEQLARTVAAG